MTVPDWCRTHNHDRRNTASCSAVLQFCACTNDPEFLTLPESEPQPRTSSNPDPWALLESRIWMALVLSAYPVGLSRPPTSHFCVCHAGFKLLPSSTRAANKLGCREPAVTTSATGCPTARGKQKRRGREHLSISRARAAGRALDPVLQEDGWADATASYRS